MPVSSWCRDGPDSECGSSRLDAADAAMLNVKLCTRFQQQFWINWKAGA